MGSASKRSVVEDMVFVEQACEAPMTPDGTWRALALLARWAAKRARKTATVGGGDADDLVTRLLSNGCKLSEA